MLYDIKTPYADRLWKAGDKRFSDKIHLLRVEGDDYLAGGGNLESEAGRKFIESIKFDILDVERSAEDRWDDLASDPF